jgi:hypothetical protein
MAQDRDEEGGSLTAKEGAGKIVFGGAGKT